MSLIVVRHKAIESKDYMSTTNIPFWEVVTKGLAVEPLVWTV